MAMTPPTTFHAGIRDGSISLDYARKQDGSFLCYSDGEVEKTLSCCCCECDCNKRCHCTWKVEAYTCGIWAGCSIEHGRGRILVDTRVVSGCKPQWKTRERMKGGWGRSECRICLLFFKKIYLKCHSFGFWTWNTL